MVLTNSVVLILITIFLLYGIYRNFEFNWPENYFGPDDKPNIFLSTNPLNYLGFRIMPVLAGIVIIEGAAYKASNLLIDARFEGMLTGLIFALFNDGRALYDLLSGSSNIEEYSNTIFQSWLHLLFIFILTIIGLFAGFIIKAEIFLQYLPNIAVLMDNVWATFLTAIILYYLYKISKKPKTILLDQVIKSSALSINIKTIYLIEKLCEKFQADQILVKSICIAENIERPLWFRQIENFFSIFLKKGTYGIMQIKSDKPISDEMSVELAISKYFKDTKLLSFSEKMLKVRGYNNNQKYIDLVEEIYKYIFPISNE
jgi:hypothetical protein